MAEKAEKKPEAAALRRRQRTKPQRQAGRRDCSPRLPVLLGGVMVIEAVVLFAGFKILGGGKPQPATGAELVARMRRREDGNEGTRRQCRRQEEDLEIHVVDSRPPTRPTAAPFLYDVSIYVVSKADNEDR